MVRSTLAMVLIGAVAVVPCGLPSQAGEPSAQTSEPSADTTAGAQPQVFYLQTEFLPYTKNLVERGIPYRLGRELVRQAVLIAARDEMGLVTCDESLRETAPLDAEVIRVLLNERADLNEHWNLKLIPYDIEQSMWEKTYKYFADGNGMYADIVPKLEADTHGLFLEALRGFGLKGQKPALRAPQLPGKEIDNLLMKVDFVAQYGAVRAAHHAIAAHGETPEWLGVLVRGYGNLAMLTAHHWNSSTEVFTARSWLYAQRLMVSCKESDLALWHHAYAAAMGGKIDYATVDLEKLEKRQQANEQTTKAEKVDVALPAWTKLIRPYCMCDREAIAEVGRQNVALRPWATRIRFLLSDYCWLARWMYEDAYLVRRACPTAYGVYNHLAEYGKFPYIKRIGREWAPIEFAKHIPTSLGKLSDLPESVRQEVDSLTPKQSVFGQLFGGGGDESVKAFSKLPMALAGELRDASEKVEHADLSWSALAYLIEEEQFVEVAQGLLGSGVYVDREQVDAVMPLIKDHRYAPVIDALHYDRRAESKEWKNTLELIKYEDPRRNMTPMFRLMWGHQDKSGRPIGYDGFKRGSRNFTLPGMVENTRQAVRGRTIPSEHYTKMLAAELAAVAPHFDNGTLLSIKWTKNPTPEQLKQWESKLSSSPYAFRCLGDSYRKAGDSEAAMRCYAKSLAWISTAEATHPMSELLFAKGDYDTWEKTLLTFLKTDPQTQQLGPIRKKLIIGFAARGMWAEARPHAITYGETGKYDGILAASFVTEGLGEWEESEKWIRQLSEQFNYAYGFSWYFWCRRTGRGDLAAASEKMHAYWERYPPASLGTHIIRGICHYGESEPRVCIESYQKALAYKPSFTCTFMISQLARQLGDDNLRDEVLAKMEKASVDLVRTAKPEQVDLFAAAVAILELVKSGDASKERLDRIDQLLFKLQPEGRSAFAHYLAVELFALGKKAKAEWYWRQILALSPRDDWSATLAGIELVKLHGTSRPDDDVFDPSDVWPRPGTDSESELPTVEEPSPDSGSTNGRMRAPDRP